MYGSKAKTQNVYSEDFSNFLLECKSASKLLVIGGKHRFSVLNFNVSKVISSGFYVKRK